MGESQGPPISVPLDMTTPLGLSRQHLSYLQEIGSGWFGKVSGWGWEAGSPHSPGLYSCFVSIPPAPTTSHLLPASPCPLHPPITLTSVHLSPTPTHPIPPHLSVSASLLTPLVTLLRHLALHGPFVHPSIRPSLHPSDSGPVSLSPHAWWGTRVAGYLGRAWKEGEVGGLWWVEGAGETTHSDSWVPWTR